MKRFVCTITLILSAIAVYAQTQTHYDVTATSGNGLRFWNGNNNYKIHMGDGSEYHYGPVTDYSIKTNMSGNTPGRGWTWGVIGQVPIAARKLRNLNSKKQLSACYLVFELPSFTSGYILRKS